MCDLGSNVFCCLCIKLFVETPHSCNMYLCCLQITTLTRWYLFSDDADPTESTPSVARPERTH